MNAANRKFLAQVYSQSKPRVYRVKVDKAPLIEAASASMLVPKHGDYAGRCYHVVKRTAIPRMYAEM